jgi:GrpB-like predicted nucleotidyltransferase (UPF0157 family)
MAEGPSLDQRLAAAGAGPRADPVEAWRLLRAAEGRRATVIDLYELVGRPRGLAAHELPVAERLALSRAALPDIWPGFANTTGSDRPEEPVELVEYDPGWPERYERWRSVISEALGETALRIEHVGSTAVPGLPAKPVIDIQVSVEDITSEAAYVPRLESVGLQLRSRDALHRYLRPFPDQPREVHVHVCPSGSDWERDHLLFRDYLRADASARDAYARTKRQAAERWSDDRLAYTDAKTESVLGILEQARRWSQGRRGVAGG